MNLKLWKKLKNQSINMKNQKKILADLATLPGFKLKDKNTKYCILGECNYFRIRVLQKENEHLPYNTFLVHFGEKKTWDKWSNSTNFETELNYELGMYRPNLKESWKWAKKVCDSKLFNFNTYFRSLDMWRENSIKNV